MKGRRFLLLALLVGVLVLMPYAVGPGERGSGHTPYDQLVDKVPEAYFDVDGDLLRDGEEAVYGTDPQDVDSDDDLCPDGVEVTLWLALAKDTPSELRQDVMPLGDADGDGRPNVLDSDSDGDGLLDGWEFENGLDPSRTQTFVNLLPDRWQYYPFYDGDPRDLDADGMPDDWEDGVGVEYPDGDPDGDGVTNAGEYLNGTDPQGPDELYGGTPTKADSDHDGVVDLLEEVLGLDRHRSDTDGDGLADGTEIYLLRTSPFDADTDGDGLPDGDEEVIGSSPIMVDTDGDGLRDPDEAFTDPTIPDTDKDLIPDSNEEGALRDSDHDGVPDTIEIASSYGRGPTDPYNPDSDGDGLSDGQEDTNRNGRRDGNDPTDRNSDWRSGGETDPTMPDTDEGGAGDFEEIWTGRDPLNPNDDEVDIDTPDNPVQPTPQPPVRINLAGWGRALLVVLLVLFVIFLLAMVYNTATTQEGFLEDVLEALEEGERVLYSISLTDDVRESIFSAYRRFLAVMEAYGHVRGEPATPREFAASVRAALDLDDAALHEFTEMFEVARYSDHDLGLADRDRALAAFSAVRESVAMQAGPPDRPVAGEEDAPEGLWARVGIGRGRT